MTETTMIIEEQITESIINAARDQAERDIHLIMENIQDNAETAAETFISTIDGDDERKEEYKKLYDYAYQEYIKNNLR